MIASAVNMIKFYYGSNHILGKSYCAA